MLELSFVREHLDQVKARMAARAADIDFSPFETLDVERRAILRQVEGARQRRNVLNDQVSRLKKEGQDASELIAEGKGLAEQVKAQDARLAEIESALGEFLLRLPNLPSEQTPAGRSAEENRVVRSWGRPPDQAFTPRPHWEIGEALGILDFKRAVKLAGSRFSLLTGAGARLERALIHFMLDIQTLEHGYREVVPPFLVNTRTMTGTGQLPKFEADLFKVAGGDLWLVPTAEVPLTNLHAGETLDEELLPLRYTAYTPCFRSEAGSYGKDVRGLIRLHQFNKVELVSLTAPERSYEELERLTANAEEILRRLGLHHRVVELCTGDLGFSSARTYDLEVWLPSEGGAYREISSCSNCEAFQARRAGIRLRRRGKPKTELVHTLNGSGLAVGRTLVAILENYQQSDGTVVIPEALRSYMDGQERIA
ncbi:MAG TPA: serine--tRNA ligase [Candidatus Polarisedimenticolia bacterium]|nr:serine--tRNA ligase [Candidatus Polarisedimenticolia bacterium]